jgi:hypothetical protein
MTEPEVLEAIKIHVPAASSSNADVVANSLLKMAVLRVGRTPGVEWNRLHVDLTLASGTSSYVIGKTILQDGSFEDLKGLQYLWRTDTTGFPIPIVKIQEFNKYGARGSSTTGPPVVATLHSMDETIEFFPSPDASYVLWGYAQLRITKFDDIPEDFHDVLVNYAIASLDRKSALAMANAGLEDAKGDSLTKWEGNVIPISRSVGSSGRGKRADSHNLRGD